MKYTRLLIFGSALSLQDTESPTVFSSPSLAVKNFKKESSSRRILQNDDTNHCEAITLVSPDRDCYNQQASSYLKDFYNSSRKGISPIAPLHLEKDRGLAATPSNDSDRVEDCSYQQQIPPQGNLNCPVCYRAFFTKSDMLRHYRIHTGEKPFICPFCPYRANQKPNVSRHIKSRHPEQPYLEPVRS